MQKRKGNKEERNGKKEQKAKENEKKSKKNQARPDLTRIDHTRACSRNSLFRYPVWTKQKEKEVFEWVAAYSFP